MKIFDYRIARVASFVLLLGDTTRVAKQLQIWGSGSTYFVEHLASCGFCAIMTKDVDAFLQPRDLCKLANGGKLMLQFAPGTTVTFNYWSDADLATWYLSDYDRWHVVTRPTRQHLLR